MRYELNELLDEDLVRELTEETFEKRGGKRRWRGGLALAACAMLAVGLLNFEAIAVGVEKLWSYVAGVGAVEVGAQVAVQSGGPAVAHHGQRIYVVDGAYAKDGILYLPVDILSRDVEETPAGRPASVDLRITLSRDGKIMETGTLVSELAFPSERAIQVEDGFWFPRDSEYAFVSEKMWSIEGWGYLGAHYGPQGYVTGTDTVATFRLPQETEAEGAYTLRLTRLGSDLDVELPLTMVQPEQAGSHVAHRVVGPGTVTAVVAPDGRGVSLFAQLDEKSRAAGERLVQLSLFPEDWEGTPVSFLNAAGERRSGQVRRVGAVYTLSPEVMLLDQDFGPVTAVVIDSLTYNIGVGPQWSTSASGPEQRFPRYDNLNWVIPVT